MVVGRPNCIQESAVRGKTRTVDFRVVALDERHFLGSLVRQVVPLVVGVVLHGEGTLAMSCQPSVARIAILQRRTSNSVRVDETDGNEIMLGVKVAPVGDGEGLVGDRMVNGAPDVDDTNASLQETFSILAKVAMHAGNGSIVRLVNVDALLHISHR